LLPKHSLNPRYSSYIFRPKTSTTSLKMQGDSYPREVVVSIMTDSSINIFGDSTGGAFIFKIFEALLQIILKNEKSPWLKVSKRRFRKIVACFKCKVFIKDYSKMYHFFFKKTQEASKISGE
jgi:hypothetical protein